MGELMNDAMFSMAEAKFTMGDFNQTVLSNTNKAHLKATAKKQNVAGLIAVFLASCYMSSLGVCDLSPSCCYFLC